MNERRTMKRARQLCLTVGLSLVLQGLTAVAGEPDRVIDVWPELAPGESTRNTGEPLPLRADEHPPATRIKNITRPQLEIFEPAPGQQTGAAILILPGGGYNYVVTDKEGSEAAAWLNGLGITGCVLRYRTKDGTDRPLWQRPVQDAQRALSLLRATADSLQLNAARIGILGFSAGGQAASLAATRFDQREYGAIDDVDSESCRPDFALLIYPWQLVNESTGALKKEVTVTAATPPTFLVHAHDDNASSLSSVVFYTALKQHKVPGELHIYETGGHGYGLRPVKDSNIATWTDRAAAWLQRRGIIEREPGG